MAVATGGQDGIEALLPHIERELAVLGVSSVDEIGPEVIGIASAPTISGSDPLEQGWR